MDKKSGYLKENFRLFHIKDYNMKEFDYHYHDFNKIIVFLSGDVSYVIEGKSYLLKPYDILLVNKGDIHKPIINSNSIYERIIIWCNSDFLDKHNLDNCDLSICFRLCKELRFNLVRLDISYQDRLLYLLNSLEESLNNKAFGSKLLNNSYFLQLLVYINRIYIENKLLLQEDSLLYNNEIDEIIKYINDNLSENLSIDKLSHIFFINKYYLMHKFKECTGFTLHKYITEKRLIKVKDLILSGFPIIEAAESCGFNDYSAFLRAFKKHFNFLPNELI